MEKRDIKLDIIRCTAVVMVLVNHTIASEITVCTNSWERQIFYSVSMVFSRLGVPLFLMLSGVLLLDKKRNYLSVKSLSKRVLRVFIPLVCWSILYYILYDVIIYEDATLRDFLHLIFRPGRAGHLWYLYVLIVLYLLLPFFSAIVRNCNRANVLYLIMIWFFASGIYQFMSEMKIPGIEPMYINLHILNGMWGYLFLGWYIKETHYNVKLTTVCITVVLFTACTVGLLYECNTQIANTDFAIVSYSGAPIIIISTSIFAFFVNLEQPITNKIIIGFVRFVSRLSFGIYLNQLVARAIASRVLVMVGVDGNLYCLFLFIGTFVISVFIAICVDYISKKYKIFKILLG